MPTPRPSLPDPAAGPVAERLLPLLAEIAPGAQVRRMLPQRARRRVGPWVFVDHFGPGPVRDVPPHPHTGLQTVTWLFDGAMRHVDSLGSDVILRPGQLNWMTAGAGVAHAELEVPEAGPVHGMQLWIALPAATAGGPAAFGHHAELPRVRGAALLMGEVEGERSPARADWPALGLELRGPIGLGLPADHEHAVAVAEGRFEVGGVAVGPGELLYLGRGRPHLQIDGAGKALLLGGLPLPDPLIMWWNFVVPSADALALAREAWMAGRLCPPVAGTALPPLPAPPLP